LIESNAHPPLPNSKLGTIFRDAAEHFEALGKLFGQMVELQATPVVGSSASSPAPGSGTIFVIKQIHKLIFIY